MQGTQGDLDLHKDNCYTHQKLCETLWRLMTPTVRLSVVVHDKTNVCTFTWQVGLQIPPRTLTFETRILLCVLAWQIGKCIWKRLFQERQSNPIALEYTQSKHPAFWKAEMKLSLLLIPDPINHKWFVRKPAWGKHRTIRQNWWGVEYKMARRQWGVG